MVPEPIGRGAVARWANHVGDSPHALFQLMVNASQLVCPLKVPCSKAEARKHKHQQQSMPELQPPTDGAKEFHSIQ